MAKDQEKITFVDVVKVSLGVTLGATALLAAGFISSILLAGINLLLERKGKGR